MKLSFFDLSQKIENGMTYIPDDPQPRIIPDVYQGGVDWKVSELHLGSHSGTHIDAAAHYIKGGKTIDQYLPERFIISGIVVALPGLHEDESITPDRLENALKKLPKGGALVLRTDWNQYWGQPKYMENPFLSPESAQKIVEAGASLVGIDALNIDSTVQDGTKAHEILLGNDVLVVENLTGLDQLSPDRLYRFSFLPLLLPGIDGSPIRAIAWEEPT